MVLEQDDWQELTDDEMHMYSRQILLEGWDLDAQEKLKLSNVFIVGCGGIGCTTAELLARAGVGKISLIDPDRIEMSNLQRQIAYTPADIGFYKAEILAQRLRAINPHIQVDSYTVRLDATNATTLIAQQDLVLDGCDNFTTRYIVNEVCLKFAVPLISASAIGFQGQLFMVEGESACYACLFPKDQHANESLSCTDTGVLATTPNVMASLQAHHALIYLGLGCTALQQKLLLWNGLTMQQRILSFEKDPDCVLCQASHTAKAD